MTYDDHGTPVQGTAQWIGKNRIVMPDDVLIIGIYTVSIQLCRISLEFSFWKCALFNILQSRCFFTLLQSLIYSMVPVTLG